MAFKAADLLLEITKYCILILGFGNSLGSPLYVLQIPPSPEVCAALHAV